MYSRPFFPGRFEDNPSLIYFSLLPMLGVAICATYLFTVNPSVLILKVFITVLSGDVSKDLYLCKEYLKYLFIIINGK